MSQTPPVSPLEEHLGYWLRVVSNQVSHAFARKVEARGVTVAEWVVLRIMFDAPPQNPSQLAAQLGMTRGAISKLIDRLVDKQLVARTHSENDRRYQSVALAPSARRLVPKLAKLADQNDQQFFGQLTSQQRQLVMNLLQDIVHRHGWQSPPLH